MPDIYQGHLHVVDAEGERVGTLKWIGDLWTGTGEWVDMRDQETSQKIADAISLNQDLAEIEFHDMFSTRMVLGWQGFSGYFQALSDVLPPLGLDVDDETIVWPTHFTQEVPEVPPEELEQGPPDKMD